MSSDPHAAGFDAPRLVALGKALQERVAARRLPGAVFHVERRGVVAAFDSVGLRDPASGAPMRKDAIFRIYSMTKPIVSVAVMRLFEEGRLRLDDPVARFLPEFAATQVLVEARRRRAADRLRARHDGPGPAAPHGGLDLRVPAAVGGAPPLHRARSLLRASAATPSRSPLLAALPLQRQPGSAWEYSRATDVLGRIVEVLAGRPLGEHLRETLFEPLEMTDTGFHVPADRHDRMAEALATDPDSGEAVTLLDLRAPAALQSGGGGLASTTADYARFVRMLLRGGQLGRLAHPRAQDDRVHDQRSPRRRFRSPATCSRPGTASASASRCASPPAWP